MKKLRAILHKNPTIKCYLSKVIGLIESCKIKFFYAFKVWIEITSLFLVFFVLFFSHCWSRKRTDANLFLFLIGKNIDNMNIVNFDFYHLGNRIKDVPLYKSMGDNFVELYFENKSLVQLIKRNKILLSSSKIKVLVSSWNPYAKSISHPSKLYFSLIKWLSKDFKLVIMGWDTVSSGFWGKNIINRAWVDVNVVENPNLVGFNNMIEYKCKISSILMPINIQGSSTKLTNDRDVDVFFFSGKINSYRDYRIPFIEELKNLNVKTFLQEISKAEDLLTYEDLYSTLGRSKIGINFSRSVNQNEQLKGRVWETMLCGALLLEQENSQITNYFTPNEHFIFFTSPKDLAHKVVFYLNNPAELKKIAEAGRSKAISLQGALHL